MFDYMTRVFQLNIRINQENIILTEHTEKNVYSILKKLVLNTVKWMFGYYYDAEASGRS